MLRELREAPSRAFWRLSNGMTTCSEEVKAQARAQWLAAKRATTPRKSR